MKSVLESNYQEASRPYSQNELKNMSNTIHRNTRLGNIMALHKDCSHLYLTKQNGKKEKEMLKMNTQDVGKCSVCWKINKTPGYLRDKAKNLASDYYNTFIETPKFLSYRKIDLENAYYKWLYEDFH